jgi:DNA-binding ferritin-like protein
MPEKIPLLTKENFKETIDKLQVIQSSVKILCVKVSGYRINIEGGNFYEYHTFLGLVVEKLEKTFYDVGERIRMLGGVSMFSTEIMLAQSKIKDSKSYVTDYEKMVRELEKDFSQLGEMAREVFALSGPLADAGTIALVTGLCFNVFEHFAWETRAMRKG